MDTSHPGRDRTVTGCADLVRLLADQHDELGLAISRLPDLTGEARADQFLHVRRQLAVHEALEAELVWPRLPGEARPDPTDVHTEMVAAEAQDTGTAGFERAVAVVLATQLRHAEAQEATTFGLLTGALTEVERAVAGTAVLLWHGEGDAYLGNRYAVMVETAREQLRGSADPGHGPPL